MATRSLRDQKLAYMELKGRLTRSTRRMKVIQELVVEIGKLEASLREHNTAYKRNVLEIAKRRLDRMFELGTK